MFYRIVINFASFVPFCGRKVRLQRDGINAKKYINHIC